ncbi:MAG: AMP-binding protein [Pseudonocardiaceae bacterium]|nr:AMP-binding protein [Pseudonocardiaceae bacterium]
MSLLASLNHDEDLARAVRIGEVTLSRQRLLEAATAVADQVAGARSAAIHATASPETVIAVVGCLIAGVPAVPVPPDSGPVERRHILTDSGAALWLDWQPPEDVELPAVPVDPAACSAGVHPEPPEDAAALVMYTSGTTGAPKGVVLSRRAIAADLDALADAWAWTPEDILVHGLPLFHVHGLILGVLGALRVGSPLVHTVRPTPESYAAAGGSLYFGVPTVWSRLCDDASLAGALSGARLLVSGSAALPSPVFDRLSALTGHTPVERYGMTETLITLGIRADGERRAGWVGPALAGIQARIRDERGGQVAPDGETVGELEVRGSTLFDGYLGRPEATAACWTTDGWFRTGDAAVVDEHGYHRIVGRQSVDIIKSGGYRVGAGEVESVLLGHPSVAEAAVVGVPDVDLGQRIVAYLVGNGIDATEITDFVAGQLSIHKRPREVRVVESLPRNAMGKVQKTALLSDDAS